MNDAGYLDVTRSSYDAVAVGYDALARDQLAGEPVLRSMLGLFAELIGEGRTADVGCGPGHITGFLRDQGLDVFGIDLSPGMVEQARSNYPRLHFEVGSMAALVQSEASLAGVNAWFSTIHIPDNELPGVLVEFHRVLAPGAPLMLAFQVGDGPQHFTEAWGYEVDLVLHRRRPEAVAAMLGDAGFRLLVTTVLDRTAASPPKQWAFLIALKPE